MSTIPVSNTGATMTTSNTDYNDATQLASASTVRFRDDEVTRLADASVAPPPPPQRGTAC
ncbi:hypothetical protein SCLCIDRAFT_1223655 [Scleroderma citrinum Foug A]|uniref:Uncharacterized protein n=1 Tax=Scleroderma citrinum Foug A TaxID=1036808 RepID=A0A0C2ZID8_9AGAM|nr:hypothetical protein SCLCIDRAFT_1223655 [Scleroderma citrinum Foug A]